MFCDSVRGGERYSCLGPARGRICPVRVLLDGGGGTLIGLGLWRG